MPISLTTTPLSTTQLHRGIKGPKGLRGGLQSSAAADVVAELNVVVVGGRFADGPESIGELRVEKSGAKGPSRRNFFSEEDGRSTLVRLTAHQVALGWLKDGPDHTCIAPVPQWSRLGHSTGGHSGTAALRRSGR